MGPKLMGRGTQNPAGAPSLWQQVGAARARAHTLHTASPHPGPSESGDGAQEAKEAGRKRGEAFLREEGHREAGRQGDPPARAGSPPSDWAALAAGLPPSAEQGRLQPPALQPQAQLTAGAQPGWARGARPTWFSHPECRETCPSPRGCVCVLRPPRSPHTGRCQPEAPLTGQRGAGVPLNPPTSQP